MVLLWFTIYYYAENFIQLKETEKIPHSLVHG